MSLVAAASFISFVIDTGPLLDFLSMEFERCDGVLLPGQRHRIRAADEAAAFARSLRRSAFAVFATPAVLTEIHRLVRGDATFPATGDRRGRRAPPARGLAFWGAAMRHFDTLQLVERGPCGRILDPAEADSRDAWGPTDWGLLKLGRELLVSRPHGQVHIVTNEAGLRKLVAENDSPRLRAIGPLEVESQDIGRRRD